MAVVALNLAYMTRLRLRDLKFTGFDGSGMSLYACVDFELARLDFRDLTDDEGNGRYGYGVDIREASRDGRVHDLFMNGGRHIFTTNAYGLTRTSLGVPRHVKVSDSLAIATINAAFDTHFERSDIEFADCTAHGIYAWGFALRGRRVKVGNRKAFRTIGPGFWVRDNATDARLSDCVAKENKSGTNPPTGVSYVGRGVQVDSPDTRLSDIFSERADEAAFYVSTGVNRLRAAKSASRAAVRAARRSRRSTSTTSRRPSSSAPPPACRSLTPRTPRTRRPRRGRSAHR